MHGYSTVNLAQVRPFSSFRMPELVRNLPVVGSCWQSIRQIHSCLKNSLPMRPRKVAVVHRGANCNHERTTWTFCCPFLVRRVSRCELLQDTVRLAELLGSIVCKLPSMVRLQRSDCELVRVSYITLQVCQFVYRLTLMLQHLDHLHTTEVVHKYVTAKRSPPGSVSENGS